MNVSSEKDIKQKQMQVYKKGLILPLTFFMDYMKIFVDAQIEGMKKEGKVKRVLKKEVHLTRESCVARVELLTPDGVHVGIDYELPFAQFELFGWKRIKLSEARKKRLNSLEKEVK